MCGRFSLKSTIQAIEDEFSVEEINGTILPRYNIAPTQDVPVVIYESKRLIKFFRWGLIPSWAKDKSIGNKMINARAETLTTKVSFKNLLKQQRCIIIADGFYEWEKGTTSKNPYYFCLKSEKPFGFAGLWARWNDPEGSEIQSCTIITVEANALVKEIHNRMPAILEKSHYSDWLDNKIIDEKKLFQILKPFPEEKMKFFRVSKLVNSPLNDKPSCIKPAD